MKLLYITNARIPTEKAHGLTILKSCEAFARAGASVRLIVPRRKQSSPEAFQALGIERNFGITFLPTADLYGAFVSDRIGFFLQAWSFYVSAKLWLLFRSRSWMVYTRDIPALFFAWLGFRVVYECHFISSHRRFFFFAARRAFRVVAISQALKDAFVRAGFDERNILVAPSGVDLSVFDVALSKEEARRRVDVPQGKRIVAYTGNFTTMGKDKGISDILHALKQAPDILFVAVGGSEKDIARYGREARAAGVSDRVILRGHVPQSVLALHQKAADVLLMPFPDMPHYRFHMSPVKMFEYMASGTPVVASDLPTIREVLSERNAFLVLPGDSVALADGIRYVGAHPEEAAARALRAREDVASYTWKNRARRILAFVASLA